MIKKASLPFIIVLCYIFIVPVMAYGENQGSPGYFSGVAKDALKENVINREFEEFTFKDFFTCEKPKRWSMDTGEGYFGLSDDCRIYYPLQYYALSVLS